VALAAVNEDVTGETLNLDPHELERLFVDAGFTSVSATADPGRVAVLARRP